MLSNPEYLVISWSTNVTNRTWFLVFVALMLTGCAHHSHRLEDVQGPVQWGAQTQAMRFHHLYFAGQPDDAAWADAKASGVDVVVNMRLPQEQSVDQRPAVEAAGLQYYSIPVGVVGDEKSLQAFAEMEQVLKAHRGQKVLVHCASGNRVAAWFATHLANEDGVPADESLAIARKVGLTNPSLDERVQGLLGSVAVQ